LFLAHSVAAALTAGTVMLGIAFVIACFVLPRDASRRTRLVVDSFSFAAGRIVDEPEMSSIGNKVTELLHAAPVTASDDRSEG
jgi:hypothetical protein